MRWLCPLLLVSVASADVDYVAKYKNACRNRQTCRADVGVVVDRGQESKEHVEYVFAWDGEKFSIALSKWEYSGESRSRRTAPDVSYDGKALWIHRDKSATVIITGNGDARSPYPSWLTVPEFPDPAPGKAESEVADTVQVDGKAYIRLYAWSMFNGQRVRPYLMVYLDPSMDYYPVVVEAYRIDHAKVAEPLVAGQVPPLIRISKTTVTKAVVVDGKWFPEEIVREQPGRRVVYTMKKIRCKLSDEEKFVPSLPPDVAIVAMRENVEAATHYGGSHWSTDEIIAAHDRAQEEREAKREELDKAFEQLDTGD